MKCYLRGTLNDLRVTIFFSRKFGIAIGNANFRCTQLDLILTILCSSILTVME